MGEVVKMRANAAQDEFDRLLAAVENGGLLVYLMVPETEAVRAFIAFEFSGPVVTQDGMVAAHILRDRFQADAAFKTAAEEYLFSVGAIYSADKAA